MLEIAANRVVQGTEGPTSVSVFIAQVDEDTMEITFLQPPDAQTMEVIRYALDVHDEKTNKTKNKINQKKANGA